MSKKISGKIIQFVTYFDIIFQFFLKDLLCRTDNEKERVKKAFQEMENHIKMLEDERRDLVIAQGTQRSSISQLEDSHKTLKEKLRASEDELRITKANYNQLKYTLIFNRV